jgi:hypothetical protein
MYVWNQSKARFYLDNVKIELFSINWIWNDLISATAENNTSNLRAALV